ncbi:MAG: hypothetical protein SF162_15515 [bacterium]|nr:hypothetical protein [bacterium]
MIVELIHLARVLLRRWWLIAIPTVIAAAFALPGLLDRAPASTGGYGTVITYSAVQAFEAIPRSEGDYQDIWLSSEYTVNAFSEWVTGGRFKDAVTLALSEQGITINPAALSIAADNERSVGEIFLNYPDSTGLEAAATAVIDVLTTRSQEFFAQLGGQPARVTLLDQTPITAAPPPIVDRFSPLLRIGLGLLAGIGLAVLAHLFDPALRRREEVEMMGVRVLSNIPKR